MYPKEIKMTKKGVPFLRTQSAAVLWMGTLCSILTRALTAGSSGTDSYIRSPASTTTTLTGRSNILQQRQQEPRQGDEESDAESLNLLGDEFDLFFSAFNTTSDAAVANCPVQHAVLLTCVQAECPSFVQVCEASNMDGDMNGTASTASETIFGK